jgi:hypothetical protein
MGLSLEKRYTFIIDIYIETYHNQIKSYCFGRARNTRVNRMICPFTSHIIKY